jgi:hypothetical protein
MSIRAFQFVAALCIVSLPLLPSPVRADELSDLDLLSRATDDSRSGLAMARDQIGNGDLSGALATLERLQINHPETDEAQLLHASLLCRLDDRSGAASEFAELRKREFSDRAWKDANAPCADSVAARGPVAAPKTEDVSPVQGSAVRIKTRTRRPGF